MSFSLTPVELQCSLTGAPQRELPLAALCPGGGRGHVKVHVHCFKRGGVAARGRCASALITCTRRGVFAGLRRPDSQLAQQSFDSITVTTSKQSASSDCVDEAQVAQHRGFSLWREREGTRGEENSHITPWRRRRQQANCSLIQPYRQHKSVDENVFIL